MSLHNKDLFSVAVGLLEKKFSFILLSAMKFLLLATIVIVAGLGLLFVPSQKKIQSRQTPIQSGQTSQATKRFTLVVKQGKLTSGPQILSVTQGEKMTIVITSDVDEEFHLHGYDKSVDLEKDKPAELTFTADIAGRFPYELEMVKKEIGALEVQPK